MAGGTGIVWACKQANPQITVKRIDKIRFIIHIIICNNPAKYTHQLASEINESLNPIK